LTRHAFVPGVTGSGKTNTIFHLLKQAAGAKIPFLVIEPAKTEYRALLSEPELTGKLRVYTLGSELISPFRLNPFEVLPGCTVSVHLDLLRSVFAASFGMWTPLPQVLEQCLYRIYERRGWDLAANRNNRLDEGGDPSMAFPTLSDLVTVVDEVTRTLGYEERISADIRAALHTRLNSLRAGGKGRMFDVQRSLPIVDLLAHPTILELEGMGDDDDKAFAMGLILIRLAEYRRSQGEADRLEHLLVIEEAHRLLANVAGVKTEEQADPRGKAVESFSNLLSEVRAFGQGVIVADQIPAKLAPDVIKNTHLKIAHRIVAEDDRLTLAGTMAMNEQQAQALSVLTVGQAAVFSEGDDAPVLVQVPPAKGREGDRTVSDEEVCRRMAALRDQEGWADLLLPFPGCKGVCTSQGPECQAAAHVVEHPAFQRAFSRAVLSMTADPVALDRLWPDVLATIRANRPPDADEGKLLACLAVRAAQWYANRRGAQAGWSYAAAFEVAERLKATILEKASGTPSDTARSGLRDLLQTLARRTLPPYPACAWICHGEPPLCIYRHAVADLVVSGSYFAAWRDADKSDAASKDHRRRASWDVCLDAGYALIEFPESETPPEATAAVNKAARRLCLCFAQQMLASDIRKPPRTAQRILEKITEEGK
jgi:hypothetical protein